MLRIMNILRYLQQKHPKIIRAVYMQVLATAVFLARAH
jgi:hypothetical protein